MIPASSLTGYLGILNSQQVKNTFGLILKSVKGFLSSNIVSKFIKVMKTPTNKAQ